MEDLNNILNAGDVPNIFAQDELDTIFTAMKPVVLDLGLQPTKANLYSAFTKRVRANTHSVVCMRYATCAVFVLPSIVQRLTMGKLSTCFLIKIANVSDSFSLLNSLCLAKRVNEMITKELCFDVCSNYRN